MSEKILKMWEPASAKGLRLKHRFRDQKEGGVFRRQDERKEEPRDSEAGGQLGSD